MGPWFTKRWPCLLNGSCGDLIEGARLLNSVFGAEKQEFCHLLNGPVFVQFLSTCCPAPQVLAGFCWLLTTCCPVPQVLAGLARGPRRPLWGPQHLLCLPPGAPCKGPAGIVEASGMHTSPGNIGQPGNCSCSPLGHKPA